LDQVLTATRLAVVEGVGDHENLGALFRTAAALGVGGVLLDDQCADPLYRRSVRVSLGWSLHVPWCRVGPLPHVLGQLGDAGFTTVALTPSTGAVDVDAAAGAGVLDGKVALLLGAEGPGLSDETLAVATHRVRVPMAGDVDSLNVATAFGVVAAFAAARAGWE
jgi:tRNA G18 (ribose-2'-O)-methylase SpoU